METQEQVEKLEKQLKKRGRLLNVVFGLLVLIIASLASRWVLATEGRLDVQGKRVYVHAGSGLPATSTMLPVGFEAHNLDAASEPYGRHAALAVAGDGASLTLRENSTGLNEDVQLFVAGGKSGLTVRDGLQRERISLALHDDGPRLRLLDENGQTLFQAP